MTTWLTFAFFSTFRYFVAVISDCGDSTGAAATASGASGEMKLPQNVCHFYSAPPLFVAFDVYVCGCFCVQQRLKYLMS